MVGFDLFIFWSAVILLLFVALTASNAWWKLLIKANGLYRAIKKGAGKIYTRTVNALKWQPFLAYISCDSHGHLVHSGKTIRLSEQFSRHSIFPRSRRSTD
jgi:hypothetical protein